MQSSGNCHTKLCILPNLKSIQRILNSAHSWHSPKIPIAHALCHVTIRFGVGVRDIFVKITWLFCQNPLLSVSASEASFEAQHQNWNEDRVIDPYYQRQKCGPMSLVKIRDEIRRRGKIVKLSDEQAPYGGR